MLKTLFLHLQKLHVENPMSYTCRSCLCKTLFLHLQKLHAENLFSCTCGNFMFKTLTLHLQKLQADVDQSHLSECCGFRYDWYSMMLQC